jgi:nitroimidazol reductase NimA-like FMN-containing flavoprotein (pyridoxamine 5'-phosphate oxidase superfamily)
MTNEFGMDVLTDDECWELLRTASVGRLAVDVGGRPDIYPINFVIDEGTIVFRTGAGTKLAAAALMHHVAFEIDGYHPHERTAWSVVIKGWADQVEHMDEVFNVEELPLFPWAAHPKPNFVKITPHELTGRRFHVVDDVAPDSSIGWDPVEAAPDAAAPAPGAEFHPGEPYMRPG